MAYGSNFVGGVNVAAADLDGDDKADIVVGPGAGGGPHIRTVHANGTDVAGSPAGGFFAYASSFVGGVFVGAHVDGNGVARIVTGAGPGGGPHVRVFNVAGAELFGLMAGASSDGAVPLLANLDGDADDELAVSHARGQSLVHFFGELSSVQTSTLQPYRARPSASDWRQASCSAPVSREQPTDVRCRAGSPGEGQEHEGN